jgi:hypothetical protein
MIGEEGGEVPQREQVPVEQGSKAVERPGIKDRITGFFRGGSKEKTSTAVQEGQEKHPAIEATWLEGEEPKADKLQWPADLIRRPRSTPSHFTPSSKGERIPVRAPQSGRGTVTTVTGGSIKESRRPVSNMPVAPGSRGSKMFRP